MLIETAQQIDAFRRDLRVRLRADEFGGLAYVPSRDKFFALDRSVFDYLRELGDKWHALKEVDDGVRELATLGLLETIPETPRLGLITPQFVGAFEEIPSVSVPLVLNAFSTAFCPLRCTYCHADDLMNAETRRAETSAGIDRVISTVRLVPSMVVVVTGGDPLTNPDRARRLIAGIPEDRAIVLDTSGVGNIDDLGDLLVARHVHVRVSLDAISEVNARARPVNTAYVRDKDGSRSQATRTIGRALELGLDVTVQTVISRFNESVDEWELLLRWLAGQGVRNWVIHIAIHGGKGRNGRALPSDEVRGRLSRFIKSAHDRYPFVDIRCTDTDSTPNSVLLVGSEGDLYTEGYAKPGKVRLYEAGVGRPDLIWALWPHLDRFGHARRYLNWNPWMWHGSALSSMAMVGKGRPKSSSTVMPNAAIETERKYRVIDENRCLEVLDANGWSASQNIRQENDTYYDSKSGSLRSSDYVVRIRDAGADGVQVALKGPRIFLGDGSHSRVEVEFPAAESSIVRTSLQDQGYIAASSVVKTRRHFVREGVEASIVIDRIDGLGDFLEIEGDAGIIQGLVDLFDGFIDGPITENYGELLAKAQLDRN